MSDDTSNQSEPPEHRGSSWSWLIPIVTVVIVAAAVVFGLWLQAQMEPPDGPPQPPENMDTGQQLYQRHCASCHGREGRGVAARYPPLVDTDWVLGDDERLILLTLHGLRGPIEVNDRTYDDLMPGFGTRLSDPEIAAILTYVRTSWDNSGDPIDTESVADVRDDYPLNRSPWTADELQDLVSP